MKSFRHSSFGTRRATREDMLFDHVCRKCGSIDLCRSRAGHPLKAIASPLLTMYRCTSCGLRQAKFRSVKVGPERPAEKATYGVDWKRS